MHRIYIWFSFSYLTLIIYIYLEHIQSTEHLQNLKKKLFGHAPSVFRRASKSLLNLVIYIKKNTRQWPMVNQPV